MCSSDLFPSYVVCLSGQAGASAAEVEADAEADAEAEAEAENAHTADAVAAEERHIPADHLVVGALVLGSLSDGTSYPGTITSIAAGKNACIEFTVKYDDGTPDEKYTSEDATKELRHDADREKRNDREKRTSRFGGFGRGPAMPPACHAESLLRNARGPPLARCSKLRTLAPERRQL